MKAWLLSLSGTAQAGLAAITVAVVITGAVFVPGLLNNDPAQDATQVQGNVVERDNAARGGDPGPDDNAQDNAGSDRRPQDRPGRQPCYPPAPGQDGGDGGQGDGCAARPGPGQGQGNNDG